VKIYALVSEIEQCPGASVRRNMLLRTHKLLNSEAVKIKKTFTVSLLLFVLNPP